MAIKKNTANTAKDADATTTVNQPDAQAVSVAPVPDATDTNAPAAAPQSAPVPAGTVSPEPAESSSQATTEEAPKVRKVGPRIGWTSEKFSTLVDTMFQMQANEEPMTLDNIVAHLREEAVFATEVEQGLLNGEDGRTRIGTKIRDSRAARQAAIESGNTEVVQLPEIQSGAGRRGNGLDLLIGPSTGA